MSIRKKILAISIGPVLVLGVITLLFILTMVKSSLMDEVQDALKGTAAATLAAYDQNTGDYLESHWMGREIMDILFQCIRMERQIRLSVWCLSEPIRHKKMQLSIKSLEVL